MKTSMGTDLFKMGTRVFLALSTCTAIACVSPGAAPEGSGGSNGSAGGIVIVTGAGGSTSRADSGTPLTDAHQPATSGRYIPLVVGAVWTWKSSDPLTGLNGTTGSTIEALETMTGVKAGVQAYRVRSTTLTGSTVNWQQDTGTAVVRHREQFLDTKGAIMTDHYYLPSKLRLDESPAHTTLGATWTEVYTDQVTVSASVSVTWTVEAVDEMVTVPAGTFKCLRVHAVETGGGGYDSHFWYARNVGKVKETGTEVRDLTGYKIP
jgi:hypothetical protein